MSTVGQPERATQNRIVALFTKELGYHYLGDWRAPEKNDLAIAEEVTFSGDHERRPDIVLYVNGIAIGLLELKNSRVSIGEGIRQCLSNQQEMFHAWFFSTVQLIFAGNDS